MDETALTEKLLAAYAKGGKIPTTEEIERFLNYTIHGRMEKAQQKTK